MSIAEKTAFAQDGNGASKPAATGITEGSVNYKTVGDRTLRIDWTRPADWQPTDRRPAIAFIHGGGWTGGKPGQFAPHSQELAGLGVVCFRIEYRLLKGKSGPPADCVSDVSDAFRFIRGNAGQLGIDPDRIAAGGGSAGGHLAAFLGMMDDEVIDGVSRKPNLLCLFNPVYDNGPGQWGDKRVGDEYPKYSPAHNISKDDPPAIVFLGTNDSLIPVETAERFRDNMIKAGVESRLFLYKDQPHGFFNANKSDGKYYRLTVDEMLSFLKTHGWIDG
ncbi:alpha/beta hydrolase [Stieleria varia]|nr:alpha/beta hydrolase [Stieleria varia]